MSKKQLLLVAKKCIFWKKNKENPNQNMKEQLEIKLKQQVRVKLTMIIFGHVKKQRSGKTFVDFYFWKTLGNRPTNDPSKKVTFTYNDSEN